MKRLLRKRPKRQSGRFQVSEILLLIYVALRIVIPVVAVILITVCIAYGLFLLIFG